MVRKARMLCSPAPPPALEASRSDVPMSDTMGGGVKRAGRVRGCVGQVRWCGGAAGAVVQNGCNGAEQVQWCRISVQR
jgi:hypothetical protein